ncbi:MAG: hypothetical protein K9J85_09275 [Desulfobacteraceae bacterium]|nr:hypothetical protein [Desulfobacteraceae bacterium]
MSLYVSGGNSAEGGWHPVALKGEIRVERKVDFTTSFGGAELEKKERAFMTITVDDTVRVEKAGATGLYTQGAIKTSVNGREIWDLGEKGRFTHTYDLSGQEPFGPDPKLAKQRVYLEVNETKGRFHLKVPGGRAEGPCISTVKAGDQAKEQTTQIAMELSAWFPDGPGEMEGSYQAGAGSIQGQYKITAYQLPGGPVTGEEKPRIWAADDPDLPEIRRQVGDEKLIPVKYKVTWDLSLMGRQPDAVPRIRTLALKMTGLSPEGRLIRTDALRMTGFDLEERVIRTEILQMTGLNPEDRIIRTEALEMTGLNTENRVIRTKILEMTGVNSGE